VPEIVAGWSLGWLSLSKPPVTSQVPTLRRHNPADPHDPQGPNRFVPDFDPGIPEFVHIGPQQPSDTFKTARIG